MSETFFATDSRIFNDAVGIRKSTPSELANELPSRAQARSLHPRTPRTPETPRSPENPPRARNSAQSRKSARARKSAHARTSALARTRRTLGTPPCASELYARPDIRARPWKSGPSGPRKAPEINPGFSPCGRPCSRRPRLPPALSPVPLQAAENAGFSPQDATGIRDSNHMRTIYPGVQFLESQFVTEKRFARGKH
jgi:hypothetical protein